VHGNVWLQLEESSDLETYGKTAQQIADLATDEITVYCGHSPEPIPPAVIAAMPGFAASVGAGEVEGSPQETFAGNGTAYVLDEPYGLLVK